MKVPWSKLPTRKRWGQTAGQFSNLGAPLQGFQVANNAIDDWHIGSLSANKIITGSLRADTSIIIGTEGGSGIVLDGTGGFNTFGADGVNTGQINIDGSGFFGRPDAFAWDSEGNVVIAALYVTGELQAATLSADRILTGELFATVKIGTAGKIWAGVENEQRTELRPEGLFGYDTNGVAQFYLQSADGKAYAAAGRVILDANGITINNQIGSQTEQLTFQVAGTTQGYLTAKAVSAVNGVSLISTGAAGTARRSMVVAFDDNNLLSTYLDCYMYPGNNAEATLSAQVESGIQAFADFYADTSQAIAKLFSVAGVGSATMRLLTNATLRKWQVNYGAILELYSDNFSTLKGRWDASDGDLNVIKSVSYDWPASQGAANTHLQNDGSGNLSWGVAKTAIANGGSGTDFVLSATAGTWETDTVTTLTFTPAATSYVVALLNVYWKSDTVRAQSVEFRAILDDTTVGYGTTVYQGCHVANSTHVCQVVIWFSSVTAASHTLKLQTRRANAADTITIDCRQITALIIPA